jgi:hypothetical protein
VCSPNPKRTRERVVAVLTAASTNAQRSGVRRGESLYNNSGFELPSSFLTAVAVDIRASSFSTSVSHPWLLILLFKNFQQKKTKLRKGISWRAEFRDAQRTFPGAASGKSSRSSPLHSWFLNGHNLCFLRYLLCKNSELFACRAVVPRLRDEGGWLTQKRKRREDSHISALTLR